MNIHTVALGDTVSLTTGLVPGAASGGALADPVEALGAADDVAEGTGYTLLVNLELDQPILPGGGTALQIAVPLALEPAPTPDPIAEGLMLALAAQDDDEDE